MDLSHMGEYLGLKHVRMDGTGTVFSRILLTVPHVENSCEINPSHMIFMIFNFAKCI